MWHPADEPPVRVEARLCADVVVHGRASVSELIPPRAKVESTSALPETAATDRTVVVLVKPRHPHSLQISGNGKLGVNQTVGPVGEVLMRVPGDVDAVDGPRHVHQFVAVVHVVVRQLILSGNMSEYDCADGISVNLPPSAGVEPMEASSSRSILPLG